MKSLLIVIHFELYDTNVRNINLLTFFEYLFEKKKSIKIL